MGSGDTRAASRLGDVVTVADADTRQTERLKNF
jgi:hypothetical protein